MADFILDVSTLSDDSLNYVEAIIEDRGRSIQIGVSQPGANQDMRIHGYGVRVVPAEQTSREPS